LFILADRLGYHRPDAGRRGLISSRIKAKSCVEPKEADKLIAKLNRDFHRTG